MNTNFSYTAPEANEPVVFEQIFAEKPGGGIAENQTYDVKPGTAMGLSGGKFAPIKGYRLVKAVAAVDTTIEIAKGSGVAVGDIIATGKLGVACTAVNTTNAAKDVVTVTLGVVVPIDTVLYQALSASANAAVPALTPVYALGTKINANEGDQMVKLVNGANLRKETAPISSEIVALLNNINLV